MHADNRTFIYWNLVNILYNKEREFIKIEKK